MASGATADNALVCFPSPSHAPSSQPRIISLKLHTTLDSATPTGTFSTSTTTTPEQATHILYTGAVEIDDNNRGIPLTAYGFAELNKSSSSAGSPPSLEITQDNTYVDQNNVERRTGELAGIAAATVRASRIIHNDATALVMIVIPNAGTYTSLTHAPNTSGRENKLLTLIRSLVPITKSRISFCNSK